MGDKNSFFLRFTNKYSKLLKGAAKTGAFVLTGGIVIYKCLNSKEVLASTYYTTTQGDSGNTFRRNGLSNYLDIPRSDEPRPTVKWDSNWDRMEPTSMVRPLKDNATSEQFQEYEEKLKKVTPTCSRHLILIRHGQYHDTATHDNERFLTDLGRDQADLTGLRLKDLDLPYTTFVSSTMTRAIETASIIHKHMPEQLIHNTDDSLREGAPIPPEPPIGSWRPEPKFFQDGARIESAFRKYFCRADPKQTEDSYEVIVCHANVIRYFICRALQFPGEGWLRLCVANCSLSLVTIQPDGLVVLEMMGDHGHIPPDQISYL